MESHPNYEILTEIGHGEAATVYRARDLHLKRFVAIKQLHEKFRRDPRQMEHFWEEAQFLANAEHDNVVQVFGVDKDRGWIIMELMRGSLDVKLSEGKLDYDLVRSVLRQTLEALKYLHANAKLHGAVKPANLLINDQGRVKLSDSAGLVAGGEIRKPTGSYKYLAPEFLNPAFGKVTPAADLYCVGFTALELAYGAGFDENFPGAGASAIDPELGWMRWQSSATEQLAPLVKLLPGIPADLNQVIGRLLEKDVSKRYASAHEALNDLSNLPILPVSLPSEAGPQMVKARVGGGGQAAAPFTPPKPPTKTVKSKSDQPPPPLKPWSKEWINKKLEDKRILYGICGTIVFLLLIFLFLPSGPAPLPEIAIKSVPTNAVVFIDDNEQKDRTDGKFKLKLGKHKVRVAFPGHKAKEEEIEVKTGKDAQREFAFNLDKEMRKVRIASVPSGADIRLDDEAKGIKTGDGKIDLVPGGTHRLVLVMDGFKEFKAQFDVAPGEGDLELGPFALERIEPPRVPMVKPEAPRKVRIATTPTGAVVEILLDGEKKGPASSTKLDLLPAKPYQLVLESPGYKKFEQAISVGKGEGEIELGPFTLEKDEPSRGIPERFALLIGVRDYGKRIPDYVFADADVDGIARILAVAGYKEANITVLKSGGTAAPTLSNIRDALRLFFSAKHANDSLMVVFEGHGFQFGPDDGPYLCPADGDPADKTTLLPLRELYDGLEKSPAHSKVIILDTCRPEIPGAGQMRLTAEVSAPPAGVAALFACGADQLSYRNLVWRHGVFMQTVARALSGEADADENGLVTVPELKQFVEGKVADYVRREYPKQPGGQTPTLVGSTAEGLALAKVAGVLLPFSRGCKHFYKDAKQEYEKSVSEFDEALKVDAKFIPALLCRGYAQIELDRYADTIRDCDEVLKLDGKNANAYCFRGEANSWFDPPKFKEAIQDLSEAIRFGPDFASPYNLRARMHRKQKNPDLALQDNNDAIRLEPLIAYLYIGRGLTHAVKKNWEAAESDYLRSIELNPNEIDAYDNMAALCDKRGKRDDAKKWLEKSNQVKKALSK